MRRYGITLTQYGQLLEFQGGRCAICERPPGQLHLSVDHDHETGAVRGLLCQRCNALLEVAVQYREAIDAYMVCPPSILALADADAEQAS